MKTTIGDYDSATGTVPVTFEHEDHPGDPFTRDMNACRTTAGDYDAAATAARAAELALGVAQKFALGLLPLPPAPEPPEPPASAEAESQPTS